MTETAIPVPDPVHTHDPAQTRRLGELLKLTVRLLADLPAPRYVWVSRTCQDIDLSFGSDLAALTRWASHYRQTITSKPTTDSDGNPMVRYSLLVPNREGVYVEARAYVPAEQATG